MKRDKEIKRKNASAGELLQRLQHHIPRELAEKMRVLGRIEGERKRVTVLCANLGGLTALSERLPQEEKTFLLNDVLLELAESVYPYEGYIDRFVGDAVVAVFGAPISHEDDAERALRAALILRERLEGLNRKWLDRLGHPLSLQLGINTGEVVAGKVGSDLRLAYTVMGDTVNTAGRLQAAARTGQICVSRETYRLTHAGFAFHLLEPLSAYELLRARQLPARTRGLHELAQAFVGREEDLSALLEVSQELEAGQGSVVTLAGEAGIGKSRLMGEWQRALGERVSWVEGRCFAHTSSVAFGPFLDLLRREAGITGEHSESEARALLRVALEQAFPADEEAQAIFASLLSLRTSAQEASQLASLSAQGLRQRLFALIERYFIELTQERPTLLVIDDLHWADASSLDLLEHLFALTGRVPLVVACTFRPQQEEAPARLLAQLEARPPRRHVHRPLGPLSQGLSERLVEQLLSTAELPDALRVLIPRKAEGNPFFVEELLLSLIERGALVHGEGGWAVTPLLTSLPVPDTLQGVLMARLDRLPAETKWLAQQASVIGRIFLYRVLMHMAEQTMTADADLGHLEREDLIRERTRDPELEYMFKHAITQEVAYQSLLPARRKELHGKVGQSLEALFSGRRGELHSVIGEHYLLGECWDRAVEHLLAAGDAAARLYAHPEARVHYREALEALAQLPAEEPWQRQRVDATLRLVAVSYLAEPPEHTLRRLTEAEQLAERLGDMERLARVHYWMGRLLIYQHAFGEALGYFRRVLEEGRHTGDMALLALPSTMVGRVMALRGHFGQARQLLNQAITPLKQAGDTENWLWTLGFLSMTVAVTDNYRTGLQSAEQALQFARGANNLPGISFSQLALTLIFLFSRDLQRMQEAGRAAIDAAEQAGDKLHSFLGLGLLAWAESRLGNYEEAASVVARRRALAEKMGGRLLCSDWFAASDAELALRMGRGPDAVALAHQSAAEARAIGGILAEGLAERTLAEALASQGAWAKVDFHLKESLRCFETGNARLEVGHTHATWGELLRQRGDAVKARAHLEQALVIFTQAELEAQRLRVQELLASLPPG
jgi:class 3 adenylate cyclase/tetratricopeptide (TPR) repeat protein